MKYKIIFLLLLTSCFNNTYSNKNIFTYTAKGFANIIENVPSNLNDEVFLIFHNKLKTGTKIRITNPDNKKSLEATVKKKIRYDNFYKILISKNIATILDLNLKFPYVEIIEIKSNKSFIAEKAITENVEKEIANKAPVDKIDINNISQIKKAQPRKINTYSILVAEFYTLKSAELLKEKLTLILKNSNYQLIHIKENNIKSYKVFLGPYRTINKLKNDYIVLNEASFEDLDVMIND